MQTTIKVQTATGFVDKVGEEMDVVNQVEDWNKYTLKDGTIIKLKQTLIKIVKISGEFDPNGNPAYVTQTAPVVVIEPPIKQ